MVMHQRSLVVAILSVMTAIAASAGSAQSQEREFGTSPDVISVSEGEKKILPLVYSDFANLSGGAVNFEIKVIRSGSLSEILERPISTLISIPSHKLEYEVGQGFKISGHRATLADQKINTEIAGLTAGRVIEGEGSVDSLEVGGYRIFQVQMIVNGAKFWHEAVELCHSSCVTVDFAIPAIDSDVHNAMQESPVFSPEPSFASKQLGGWVLQSTLGTGSVPSAVRTWKQSSKTHYVGPIYSRTKITVGEVRVTLSCGSDGRISKSYFAGESIAVARSPMKADCAEVEADTGTYGSGNRSTKVATLTGCVYHSKGSASLEGATSGDNATFKGELKVTASADLGTNGVIKNGFTIGDVCVTNPIN
jgi:hypothetical protein